MTAINNNSITKDDFTKIIDDAIYTEWSIDEEVDSMLLNETRFYTPNALVEEYNRRFQELHKEIMSSRKKEFEAKKHTEEFMQLLEDEKTATTEEEKLEIQSKRGKLVDWVSYIPESEKVQNDRFVKFMEEKEFAINNAIKKTEEEFNMKPITDRNIFKNVSEIKYTNRSVTENLELIKKYGLKYLTNKVGGKKSRKSRRKRPSTRRRKNHKKRSTRRR